jgi:hypothetical protein
LEHPTHEGDEEAKHWHPMEIDVGTGPIAPEWRDGVRPNGEAVDYQARYAQSSDLPPDCVELSPKIKPDYGDYYQIPPEHKPLNVPASFVLTKVYQHGAFLGWCYIGQERCREASQAKSTDRALTKAMQGLQSDRNNHDRSVAFRSNFARAVLDNAVILEHDVVIRTVPRPAARKSI